MSPSSSNLSENLSHADTEVMPAWKTELSERLAATRTRRLRHKEEQIALPGLEHIERKIDSRAARLAAKVAQRYANAPSYSEVLASEARARAEKAAPVTVPVHDGPTLVRPLSPESWTGAPVSRSRTRLHKTIRNCWRKSQCFRRWNHSR